MSVLVVPLACASLANGRPAAPDVRVTFVPAAPEFADDAAAYTRIWEAEGARMVAAMERISGLSFVRPEYADTAIVANVLEQASNSGYRERPMRLRASYSEGTKRATLIHELGHRLQTHLFTRSDEEHRYLFLWVYDVWTDLYGQEFADREVAIERRRGGVYPAAWDYALGMSRTERQQAWREIVAERTR